MIYKYTKGHVVFSNFLYILKAIRDTRLENNFYWDKFSPYRTIRLNVEISMIPVFLPYGIFDETQQVNNTVKSSILSSFRSLTLLIARFE